MAKTVDETRSAEVMGRELGAGASAGPVASARRIPWRVWIAVVPAVLALLAGTIWLTSVAFGPRAGFGYGPWIALSVALLPLAAIRGRELAVRRAGGAAQAGRPARYEVEIAWKDGGQEMRVVRTPPSPGQEVVYAEPLASEAGRRRYELEGWARELRWKEIRRFDRLRDRYRRLAGDRYRHVPE